MLPHARGTYPWNTGQTGRHTACDLGTSPCSSQCNNLPPAARLCTIRGTWEPTSAADQAEARKVASHTIGCAAAGWDFIPFGMDSTSALGPRATGLLWRLTRAISMRTGQSLSEVITSFFAALSTALAKGRGEMLTVSYC